MYNVFKYINQRKYLITTYSKNIFNSDLADLETKIFNGYAGVEAKDTFYAATASKKFPVHEYRTSFNWILKGINPIKDQEKSAFHFKYKGAPKLIVSIFLISLLSLLNFLF